MGGDTIPSCVCVRSSLITYLFAWRQKITDKALLLNSFIRPPTYVHTYILIIQYVRT